MSDDNHLRRMGIGQESTPGTAVNVSKLWEGEMLRSLTLRTPAYPRTPPKPLTLRQKMRLRWYRLLAKWPLQWKQDEEED